jgi:GT2 family glycosyltransferase
MVFHRSLFSHYANWYAKLLAARTKQRLAKATAPFQVDGVLGAFFLIRRSVIPAPALFDEDFFFFYEDTALAHTLANRGVRCFVIPDATIIHVGGKSRSEDSIFPFYKRKFLYLKKFYGSFQADVLYNRDLIRTANKSYFYALFSQVNPSELIKSKERHYRLAWDFFRCNEAGKRRDSR